MIIDIDQIPREGLAVEKDFEFLAIDLVEESAVFLSPTHAEVVIRRVGEEVWIKGRLTALLSFLCSRCLSPFEFPVDSRFDLICLPEEMDMRKEELDEEDMDKSFFRNGQIDLREIILEQINLSFPLKPLCSPECEGICPVCGGIRRDGYCGCQTAEEDPRWAKLKSLMRDKN